MYKSFDLALRPVAEKVMAKKRLSFEEGLVLENTPDIHYLGFLANIVRERVNANNAYYVNNRHINHTNLCVNSCKFCAFSKKEGDADGYTMSVDHVLAEARKYSGESFSEFHIVGGLHPTMPYQYYLDIISVLHDEFPDTHIQAYTAVEIAYFAEISGKSVGETLLALKEAGLGSLPGGGAEIFDDDIRRKICPEKIDANQWLKVHKAAHNAGLSSNATMLYGHIEKAEHRIDHLIGLREAQDETKGFLTFIPLAFHPKNTGYDKIAQTSGVMDLRMIAIGRLMLDNFPHIKAFWIMIGEKIAQVSLSFGADDMDGTVVEEKITHAAGAKTAQRLKINRIEKLIKEAGRIPVERDTVYNVVPA
ncbi:Aminodeoxyfutalosine synthase [hydrothermal vent metagenome]|uniref:Aminodeoxyfutalosine synthase n=1 Tax=hydrothermal vent metagenome TaxID=652676 RepID=A0A3B1CXR3_9ZZZZ